MSVPKKSSRSNASRGLEATEARLDAFIEEFIRNGHKGSPAAVSVGAKPEHANRIAYRWLQRPEVKAKLKARLDEIGAKMKLTTERTLLEVARIAYHDPANELDEAGRPKKLKDIDVDTRAAIASIELVPIIRRGAVVGVRQVIRHHDKNAALDKAMRHLGLYRKDNEQVAGFADRLVKARERARQPSR